MIPELIQNNLVRIHSYLRQNGLDQLIDWLDTPDIVKGRLALWIERRKLKSEPIPTEIDWIYSCYNTHNQTLLSNQTQLS